MSGMSRGFHVWHSAHGWLIQLPPSHESPLLTPVILTGRSMEKSNKGQIIKGRDKPKG